MTEWIIAVTGFIIRKLINCKKEHYKMTALIELYMITNCVIKKSIKKKYENW